MDPQWRPPPPIPKPSSPSPVRGSAPSPPVPWLPSPTATLQKEMSTPTSTSSCLPLSLARGHPGVIQSLVSSALCPPCRAFLPPSPPRPSCLPQQVPLSAWVRVLPQKWQKFGGGGDLGTDIRHPGYQEASWPSSWAALGSSFFLCALVSSAVKWGGQHRGDPPGPARVWKHWPSLCQEPAQGGCSSERTLSSACRSLEPSTDTLRDSHGPDNQERFH